MSRQTIIVSSVVALVVIVLIYFIVTNKKGYKYQWSQTYRADSDQPYGTKFIQKMLESYHPGKSVLSQKEPIHKVLENNKFSGKTDYVLIGQSSHFDVTDVDALKDFIADGNNVFIATLEPPSDLLDWVFENNCDSILSYETKEDTAVRADFAHRDLTKNGGYEYRFRFLESDQNYFWSTLDNSAICDSTTIETLGYQQASVNFFRVSYGEGYLYLHTSPIMFTNFFMINRDKVEYAEGVFSHMAAENLIWDELSKLPFNNKQDPYSSPLYYIMQQPALKYAWWLLLIGGLLYLIFASKRTQRVIPVLEAKSNTSLEFLNVISSLHYQNPNHLDMARKKMKYFLYFIRAKYGINTHNLTEEQARKLAERSKVDIADIQRIIDRYRTVEAAGDSYESDHLVDLYQAIENFYKKCK